MTTDSTATEARRGAAGHPAGRLGQIAPPGMTGEVPPLPRKRLLLHLLKTPADVRTAYDDCRRKFPPFPAAGATLALWRFLSWAGFLVPYDPSPAGMTHGLMRAGWRPLSLDVVPEAGDLFVVTGADGVPVHLGIVAGLPAGDPDPDWFQAADHLLGAAARPYRRRVAGGPVLGSPFGGGPDERETLPVGFWLRFG